MTLGLSPTSLLARTRAKQKQWRIDHPERIKEFHRKYNARPEVSERKLAWARQHKDELNERRRQQYRLAQEALKIAPRENHRPTDSTDEELFS